MEKLLVSSESIDCEELRQLSWSGLSPRVRPKAWRILCGYLPGAVPRQKELLQRKQGRVHQCHFSHLNLNLHLEQLNNLPFPLNFQGKF